MKIARHLQLDTETNVRTINVIVTAFVVVGNVALPSLFWHVELPPNVWSDLAIFFSGVLAFTSSLLVVFGFWEKAGLQFVR